MAFLIFLSGELKGRKFEIDKDTVTIGRSSENHIRINDPSVSSRHCQITRNGDLYSVTDLDSTNGTFLDGEQFTGTVDLSPKATVQAGEIQMVFDAPELTHVNGAQTHFATTGIQVRPGATIRTVPSEASDVFLRRKTGKPVWLLIAAGSIILAVLAAALFIVRLVRG